MALFSKRSFSRSQIASFLLLALAITILPLMQLASLGGLVFYTNGLDEANYLQYDYSKYVTAISARWSQVVVTVLHELGLSGGWINLISDLTIPLLVIVILGAALARASQLRENGRDLALLTFFSVILFLPVNPLLSWFYKLVISSHSLSWLTMPETRLWPLLRTPEPQFSYLLMSLALYVALRIKSTLPLYLVGPILYSFLAPAWLFVVLTFDLSRYLPKLNRAAPALSAVIIGCGIYIYLDRFIPAQTLALMLPSRLPLISLSGIFSVYFYLQVRESLTRELRSVAFALALAPWFSANQQVISGWIAVPSNSEQYIGALCVGFLFALCMNFRWKRYLKQLNGALLLGLLIHLALISVANYKLWRSFPLTTVLKENLQNSSDRVALSDIRAATVYSLIYPKQKPTFFSYHKVYLGLASKFLPEYLCAKAEILKDPNLSQIYRGVLEQFDASLRNETEDYYLNTIFRKEFTGAKLDVTQIPSECPEMNLIYVDNSSSR